MRPVRLSAPLVALAIVSGCYQPDATYYSTFPEPAYVSGPPGGGMDPGWQQQQYPGYPADAPAYGDTGTGFAIGVTTDAEIEATLVDYGEWIEVDGYGRVWRPYTTAVGLDFTPYESCGSWVWTDDWGWTFACEWDWGWLPFHYGRWGWFEDYWAWQPGYEWSPGWVDWRSGGDYCGWRPQAPTPGYWDNGSWVGGGSGTLGSGGWVIRDHRDNPGGWSPGGTGGSSGPRVRDDRIPKLAKQVTLGDSQWRFAKQEDFGKRIKPNLFKEPAEGLRVTKLTPRPPMRGTTRAVAAASIMQPRLSLAHQRTLRDMQRSGAIGPRTGAGSDVRIPRRDAFPGARRADDMRRPRDLRPPHAIDGSPSPVERMWPRGPRGDSPARVPSSSGIGPRPDRGAQRPLEPQRPMEPLRPSRDFPSERVRDVPIRPVSPPPRRDDFRGSSSTWSPPSRPSSPPPSRNDDRPSRGSSGGNWSPPSAPSRPAPTFNGGGSFGGSRGGGGGASSPPPSRGGGGRRR